VAPLDLTRVAALQFEQPDLARFPCLRLAFDALHQGGVAPAVLNAANEVAVEGFLARRLRFTQIPALIEAVLEQVPAVAADTLDAVFRSDLEARELAARWMAAHGERL
ncbi:MAG: 1-deoxy-D-xylulose-5-phosphate reductoisomerase, partial [Halothiobacillaceae bacterium]